MDRGEIPGFWYDEKKRKYFKILPNHVAPEGAEYSMEGIKRGMESREEVREDAMLQTFTNRTKIRRARILKSSHGVTLSRETGLTKTLRVTAAAVFPRIMEMQYRIKPLSEPQLGWPFSNDVNAMSIVKDECTSTVFTAYNKMNAAILWAWMNPMKQLTKSRPLTINQNTEITSLCLTPSRSLVKTTMGGPTKGASITFVGLHDTTQVSEDSFSPVTGVHVDFTLDSQPHAAIWDSSPCTDPSDIGEVALGTSRGVVFASPHSIRYMEPKRWSVPSHKNVSDVLAVSWFSPYILAAGLRNGEVQVFDKRVQRHVATWQHPSAVIKIRPADAHRFVVAGLQDQLHTYDVRYKSLDSSKPCDTSSKLQLSLHNPITAPYISYPSYRNSATLRTGFDVSPQLGLIAAASESVEINILDIWTGKKIVTSWKDRNWKEYNQSNDVVKHLAFFGMGEKVKGGRPSLESGLLVARGGYFEEWHW